MTLRTVFLLTFVILTLPFLLQAQLPGTGVECNCTATGDYIDPDPGVLPEVITGDTSPGGIYSISVSGSGPYNIVIHRQSDGATVYSTSLQNGYWGFSPDDDRFVFHTLSSGQLLVTLVDLTIPSGNKVIWSNTLSASDISIHFSPNGNYLVCSALNSATSASLLVIDAHTGDPSYDSYPFIFLPGGDTTDVFGAAGWGFSPDLSDRTLFYAFVNGSGLLEWRMVNLQTGEASNQTFVSHISGFWQFSPCGDMLGLVIQTDPSHMKIALHQTAHPQSSALATRDINQVTTVSFRSTALSHIVTVGGNDDVLTANEAGVACFIVPDSLIFTPKTVVGGNAVAGRVVLSSPARSGGVTVSLSSSNPGVATVPASVLVPAGQQEKTFTVQTSIVGTATKPVISATSEGTTIYDTLTVTPLELVGYDADRTDLIGGDTVNTTITLSAAAPGPGISVTLVSSKPQLVSVNSPANIATGETMTTAFLVTTPVASLDSAVISATALGDTLTVTIRVNPYVTLSFVPDSIVGGNPVAFIASRISPAPPGGIAVQAVSSDTSILIPPLMTIPEGADIIWVNPLETHGVNQPTTVTASMTAQGKIISTTLTVLPAKLESFQARADSGCAVGEQEGFKKKFIGGCTILFEAALDGEAPSSGGTLQLASSRPDLINPVAVFPIAGLAPKGLILMDTAPIDAGIQEVVLSATYRGITKVDTVQLMHGPEYTLIDLSEPGNNDYSDFIRINNAGDLLVNDHRLYRNGNFIPLETLPGYHLGGASNMNDLGWLSGAVWDTTLNINRPAYWKPDTTIILPTLEPSYPSGGTYAINNHGEIVGAVGTTVPPIEYLPVVWRSDSISVLEGYLDFRIGPSDINDSGQIIGTGSYYRASPYTNRRIAFRWDNGVLTPLPHPWGEVFFLSGLKIAAGGQALLDGYGYFHIATNTVGPGFGPPLPFNRMYPYDMNDSLDVVGELEWYVEDVGTWQTSFLETEGYLYDLKCLVQFPPGWTWIKATGINNNGTIAGIADEGGEYRLFLLTRGGTTSGTAEQNGGAVPTSYALMQNYPNPFNPSTRIRYSLPVYSKVRLTVYDLLGREVALLVNAVQAAGYNETNWNAAGLSSGVYFYRIEATNPQTAEIQFVDVRRMVLIK